MSDPAAIAQAFLTNYAAKYASADVAGLAAIYGPDSVVSMDGGSVKSQAAIAGALSPRVSAPRHSCSERTAEAALQLSVQRLSALACLVLC